MIGLPSVVDRKSHQVDISRLINTVHRLLQVHRSNHLAMDELRTRYREGGRETVTSYLTIVVISLQRSKSDVKMQTEIGERLKVRSYNMSVTSHMTVT